MKAFPTPQECAHTDFDGMDLRDYFAAKAMQGILSNIDINKVNNRFAEYVKVVHDSYKIADEMMEARK